MWRIPVLAKFVSSLLLVLAVETAESLANGSFGRTLDHEAEMPPWFLAGDGNPGFVGNGAHAGGGD
jgi:hypothetical protein